MWTEHGLRALKINPPSPSPWLVADLGAPSDALCDPQLGYRPRDETLAAARDHLRRRGPAWWMANVERIRERARLTTLLMKEDRDAVLLQLQELHRLMNEEPRLQLIAGHDRDQVDALVASKLLIRELVPKPN